MRENTPNTLSLFNRISVIQFQVDRKTFIGGWPGGALDWSDEVGQIAAGSDNPVTYVWDEK